MGRRSPIELLTLHAVRLLGVAESEAVAARYGLDRETTSELLLDFEAVGWVRHSRFAGMGGWSLTDTGRRAGEQMLCDEVNASDTRPVIEAAHAGFEPLNARFQEAVTRWQLRPSSGDPLAVNDHTDFRWDDRVIADLGSLVRKVVPLCDQLSDALARFDGYAGRLETAVALARDGEVRWIDEVGLDSCHAIWFELHEDLLASTGRSRRSPG